MCNPAFIILGEEAVEPAKKLPHRILSALKEWFRPHDERFESSHAELNGASSVHILRIPYSVAQLNSFSPGRIKRIERSINDFILRNSISQCFLPENMPSAIALQIPASTARHERTLFPCLIGLTIETLCDELGISIQKLEIAIIPDADNEVLTKAVIEQFLPWAKYLSIVCVQKPLTEALAYELMDSAGLSVCCIDGTDGALKDMDILINLSPIPQTHICPGASTLIIDAAAPGSGIKKWSKNVLIRGLEIDPPPRLAGLLDQQFLRFYNSMEFAACILPFLADTNTIQHQDEEIISFMQAYARLFRQQNFRISGFAGHYRTLCLSEIRSAWKDLKGTSSQVRTQS